MNAGLSLNHIIEVVPGPEAANLRHRREHLLTALALPSAGIAGSLVERPVRCGKKNCRCHAGEPHYAWTLSFTLQGRKYVERIPRAWVLRLQAEIEAARHFRAAVAELFALNTRLVALTKKTALRW